MRAIGMRWGVWVLVWVLVGCGTREALEVKQYTVRELETGWSEDLMVRGEAQKRLYGAVSRAEREERRGQYYSVRWRAEEGERVRVEFAYRQAGTGSRVRVIEQEFLGKRTGVAEFAVAGEAYRTGGRVISWRVRLYQGGELLGERRSFLWE